MLLFSARKVRLPKLKVAAPLATQLVADELPRLIGGLREKYKSEIDKHYWGKAKLWHDSKCIVSCGGAPLQIVKDYIQQQSGARLDKPGASNP